MPKYTHTFIDATFDGNITYTESLSQTSDRRVKTSIVDTDLKDAYDRVGKLRMRSYGHNDTAYAHNSCGFIAQEVREVHPEATRVLRGDFD